MPPDWSQFSVTIGYPYVACSRKCSVDKWRGVSCFHFFSQNIHVLNATGARGVVPDVFVCIFSFCSSERVCACHVGY